MRTSTTTDVVPPNPRPAAPPPGAVGPAVGDSVAGVAPAPGEQGRAAAGASGTAIRVGVLVDTARAEIASDAGGLSVLNGAGRAVARADGPVALSLSAAGAGVRVEGLPTGPISLTGPVAIRANGSEPLRLKGAPFRGELIARATPAGRLTIVNRVGLEDYLLGVVPREIGPVGSQVPEAVKAQAVAARTYAVRNLGRRAALGFDVYASTQDQVYGGVAAEAPAVSDAVRATRGQILTYGGQPIQAYYHSTCAGRTAAIDEVWNEPPVPYLVSVSDVDPSTGLAYDRSSSRFRWTEQWTAPELIAILNRTLADSLPGRITTLRDVRVLETTPSGRVRRMLISTDAGDAYVGKDRVRWILLGPRGSVLNSAKFTISVARDASGAITTVTAEGGGWGHGIGMCQVGAIGRARAGQDYRTILNAYYPGTQLTTLY